jgi:predicted enzyme related to lactoylglutathione lyase
MSTKNETANQPQIMVIIYVSDQERSKDFYSKVLNREPVLHVPGMTEFTLSENLLLGIMPEEGIHRILGEAVPHPAKGNGIPRCELYIPVDDPEQCYKKLQENGGKGISPAEPRNWGHVVAYGADPDGHILAFACLFSEVD